MKNQDSDNALANKIKEKYDFDPHETWVHGFEEIIHRSSAILILSEKIHIKRKVETGEQPPKISDALDRCKEQMMVRDNHKPEYFIWQPELTDPEPAFGFVQQAKKNRLTKHVINLSFRNASGLLNDYFSTKVSVVSTDISGLSKKE